VLLLALGLPQAYSYDHPCIPSTVEDLATIKASLNQEPWKSGYAALQADGRSSLNYKMKGPFATVTRNPNLNLWPWRSDMIAVFNLSRMWYFTGNSAYAQKAHDILLAWANTQTSFGGNESGLDLGDYAFRYAGGASILRGTWPGWTSVDTAAVKNYFSKVLWPASGATGNVLGPANKGSLYMAAGIAIAVFCDDTAKFNHIISLYRTFPSTGLLNTLATGEMGETGRDMGHAYGDLLGHTFVAEVAWKQGVDLYSEWDNRLLACGEYYARNALVTDTPFVPFGTIDYDYWVNYSGNGGLYTANRAALYLLQNAYKNRRKLPTPWIDSKIESQPVDGDNFMYCKTADLTAAVAPPPLSLPTVSLASNGLTLQTLGSQAAGSGASYANGVWTVTGLGNGVWTDSTDDCQFAYQTMTGDCAIVAQVISSKYSGSNNAKAGLMIRDKLSSTVSQRAWVGIVSAPSNLFECYMSGWTENWGGKNWAHRSQPLSPGVPYWLKIERRGNQVATFTSQDGTSWAATCSSYYANLPSTVYLGLFVCSGTTTPNTATFAHVAFTGGSGSLVTTPAAPAALLASGSNQAVTVRWLPSFGATAYDLLRSTTSGSGYAVIASNLSPINTSYVDTRVAAGMTYYYVARARNSTGTSGNSPQFGAVPVGALLVNLASGGTTLADVNSGSGAEGSDNAFDGNPGSKWFSHSAPAGWIQYDFGSGNAQAVKRYTITSANDAPTRDPNCWKFRGSQDGGAWTDLDSRSNQIFANRYQVNAYDIGNTTAYRFYRLEISANNGGIGVQLSELGLWSNIGRTHPDRTALDSKVK